MLRSQAKIGELEENYAEQHKQEMAARGIALSKERTIRRYEDNDDVITIWLQLEVTAPHAAGTSVTVLDVPVPTDASPGQV